MKYQDFFSKYNYDRRADIVGRTRFGTIYKARRRMRGDEVFLRVMPVDDPDGDAATTLQNEVAFVEALPEHPYIVRYGKWGRVEESTGWTDCAVMESFPLGNLAKVLDDWKLDNAEKRGLRDRILEAAAFLRSNGVKVGQLDPATIFVTEADGQLYPHLIDISGTDTDNADFETQLSQLLPIVEEKKEEPAPEPEPVVEPEPEPVPEPEAEPAQEEPQEAEKPEAEEQEEEVEEPAEEVEEGEEPQGHRKSLLLSGVAVTWVAIFALIYFLHQQRNAAEESAAAAADTVQKVIYPADEYALEEAARADSIVKAKADSIAKFKADSIAYMKKVEADRKARLVKEEKAKEEKAAAEAESAPADPPSKPAAETAPTLVPAPAPASPAEPTTVE